MPLVRYKVRLALHRAIVLALPHKSSAKELRYNRIVEGHATPSPGFLAARTPIVHQNARSQSFDLDSPPDRFLPTIILWIKHDRAAECKWQPANETCHEARLKFLT
jgi:hypothetical protein